MDLTEKEADLMTMEDTILRLKQISNDLTKVDMHNHHLIEDCIETIEEYFVELKELKYGIKE